MKNSSICVLKILALCLLVWGHVYASKTTPQENVLSIGSTNSTEHINLKLLDQNDENAADIQNSMLLNHKSESIRDTKRKSFHSLRNVEELSSEDIIVIK